MRRGLSPSSQNPPISWTGGYGGCRRQGSLLTQSPVPLPVVGGQGTGHPRDEAGCRAINLMRTVHQPPTPEPPMVNPALLPRELISARGTSQPLSWLH